MNNKTESGSNGLIGGIIAALSIITGIIVILQFLGVTHIQDLFARNNSSTSTVATTLVNSSPQPTSLKKIYSANWSNGFNGWIADAPANTSWNVNNGDLINDGSGCCAIIAPYHPTTNNYAIEAHLQMGPCTNSIGGSFGLFGEGSKSNSSHGGYEGYVAYWGTSGNFKIRTMPYRTLTGEGWQVLAQVPYQLNSSFYTLRLEFDNGNISLFVNGDLKLTINNTQYQGEAIGLEDWFCQLTVDNFSVYSISR